MTETEQVDFTQLVQTAWKTVDTGSASFEFEAPPNRTLRADESRLRQVFENLFRNAVEHGGRDVTVWVGCMDHGFYVADDGPGIPSEDREEIFERTYTSGGTGIGLAIVKQVIEAHGWEVTVTESREGGARFEVTGMESCEETPSTQATATS